MNEQRARRVAIVGAGIAGLVAGRDLARRGFAVTVYERWPDVGGQASAFEVAPGVWVERYYHHLFQSDDDMIGLHAELAPRVLEWHSSTVANWVDGKWWPFVTPLDLLRYGPLPLIDRIRLGIATLRLVRRTDWEAMDEQSALTWLRRNCGERAIAAVWAPLLLAKFGPLTPEIPLSWFWSKLALRRRKLAGGGAMKERLGYPRTSFQTISRALADDIRAHGGSVELDREVVGIERTANGLAIACAAPGAYRAAHGRADADPARAATADLAILTTPTFVTRRLVRWPAPYAAQLDAWRYRTAVVLLLELRERFSATYWTNIVDRSMPFIGLIEHTNLVPADRYPMRYLYVSNYVASDDPITRLDTDELVAHCLPGLQRMKPSFSRGDIVRAWSFREPAAQPVPSIGNRRRIVAMRSPIDGIFVANTTQIFPEDRGTNYSARLGHEIAALIAGGTRADA